MINKSYSFAMEIFISKCQDKIGIIPLNDDMLVLKSFLDFSTYIKTFKRLDHSIDWHNKFIDKMTDSKINTLSNNIKEKYGSHKRYINIVQRRHKASRKSYQKICKQAGLKKKIPRINFRSIFNNS